MADWTVIEHTLRDWCQCLQPVPQVHLYVGGGFALRWAVPDELVVCVWPPMSDQGACIQRQNVTRHNAQTVFECEPGECWHRFHDEVLPWLARHNIVAPPDVAV